MALSPRLPHQINVKLTADQWQLLEETGERIDSTLSGAIRHHLDQVLDKPVNGLGSPTRRELMHDDEIAIDRRSAELLGLSDAPVA